jgi:carboxypeptidase PM20D1
LAGAAEKAGGCRVSSCEGWTAGAGEGVRRGRLKSLRTVVDCIDAHAGAFDRCVLFSDEASPVSPADDSIFARLERVVLATHPDVMVAPWLVVAATDASHYTRLSDNVYRFLPVRLGPADLARIHGTDERIAVEDYENTIRFFLQLMLETAAR